MTQYIMLMIGLTVIFLVPKDLKKHALRLHPFTTTNSGVGVMLSHKDYRAYREARE